MMDGLIPLHNENRNCFEDVAVTVCSWYHRRYEYMYKNSWLFQYCSVRTSDKKSIGECLSCDNPKQFALYTEHSGISIDYCQFDEVDQGIEDINHALEQDCIVALTNMDMFWVPWTTSYRQKHGGHTFIVKKFDVSTKNFSCMDPYLNKDLLDLNYNNLRKATNGRYLVYSAKYEEKKDFNIYYIIQNAANNMLKLKDSNNAFSSMRIFADDVDCFYDARVEMQGYKDFFSIPIYNNLQTIGRTRKQFAELLQFLAKLSSEPKLLEELSRKFLEFGKKWDKLKILFGKEIVVSDYTWAQRKAPKKIYEIAELEEKCAQTMLSMNLKNE